MAFDTTEGTRAPRPQVTGLSHIPKPCFRRFFLALFTPSAVYS